MKHWLLRTGWALGAAFHLGLAAGAPAVTLTLMVPPTPGLIEKRAGTGTWHGPAVDLLENMMWEAGLGLRFVEAPGARMLLNAKTVPLTCAVGAPRSATQEANYLWFGPLTRTRIVVLARPDESTKIENTLDLKGRTVAAVRDSLGAELLTAQGLPFTAVADHRTGHRMLLKNRIDFWVANELLAARIAGETEGPAPKLAFVMHTVENYLACHPGLPDDVQARLQSAVQSLLRRGAMAPFGVPGPRPSALETARPR